MTQSARMTLPPVTLDNATEPAKTILETAQKQVGFIPNMYANMVNSPSVLDTYLTGYKWFREKSGFTPAEQEIVFLTISRENGCDYCMSAHSMIADKMSKVPQQALEAIRSSKPIPDEKLQALSRFTSSMFLSRGTPSASDMDAFISAGYTERHVLEVILALAVKTLSNYSNHVFHTTLDDRFSAYKWENKQ